MNRNALLTGAAFMALMASASFAAEQSNTQVASSETSDQKCARWADHQNLQGAVKAEYIKDCQLDLRVPEKNSGGGDD